MMLFQHRVKMRGYGKIFQMVNNEGMEMKKILLGLFVLFSGAVCAEVSNSEINASLKDLRSKLDGKAEVDSNMGLTEAITAVQENWKSFSWQNVAVDQVVNNSGYHYALQDSSGAILFVIPSGQTVAISNVKMSAGQYVLVPYKNLSGTTLSDPLSGDEYNLAGGNITIAPAEYPSGHGMAVGQTVAYQDTSSGSMIAARSHVILAEAFFGNIPGGVVISLDNLVYNNQKIARVMPRIAYVNTHGINLFKVIIKSKYWSGAYRKDVIPKLDRVNTNLEDSSYGSRMRMVTQFNSYDQYLSQVSTQSSAGNAWLWADVPTTVTDYYIIGSGTQTTMKITDFSGYLSEK